MTLVPKPGETLRDYILRSLENSNKSNVELEKAAAEYYDIGRNTVQSVFSLLENEGKLDKVEVTLPDNIKRKRIRVLVKK